MKYELPVTFIDIDQIDEWTEDMVKKDWRDSDKILEELEADIRKNGLKEPLVVMEQGTKNGKKRFVGRNGGHRYLVLKKLGYKAIPCKLE